MGRARWTSSFLEGMVDKEEGGERYQRQGHQGKKKVMGRCLCASYACEKSEGNEGECQGKQEINKCEAERVTGVGGSRVVNEGHEGR